jgi:uroporphyrinogen-III synthase
VTGKSLAGCRVVVTRPAAQAAELVDAIEQAGGEAIRFPVLEIAGRSTAEVAQAFRMHPAPDLVCFVSPNAVRYGHGVMTGLSARTIAIGPATAAALGRNGISVDIVPDQGFDSEHLLAHPALQNLSGKSVTIVRGTRGRELLGDTLQSRGARVSYLAVYERRRHVPGDGQMRALERACKTGNIGCVIVMSVESLRNFFGLLPPACHDALLRTPLVAPSERVIQTAQELIPGAATILAPGPQVADLLAALIMNRQSGKI